MLTFLELSVLSQKYIKLRKENTVKNIPFHLWGKPHRKGVFETTNGLLATLKPKITVKTKRTERMACPYKAYLRRSSLPKRKPKMYIENTAIANRMAG
jgi:hypothetical protein